MHEEIRAFRRSRGRRTGRCAQGGRRCYRLLRNIRRCNGRRWRNRTSVFLDYSHWTHYRSSQGHAIGQGAAGRIFHRSDKCCLCSCLCRPITNRKFRRINLRWSLPFQGGLRFIPMPKRRICAPPCRAQQRFRRNDFSAAENSCAERQLKVSDPLRSSYRLRLIA
jgi:hypothetical protein